MNKALFAVLYSIPVMLAAQTPAIAIGTRVSVDMHDKSRIEGTLMAQSAESLAVASPRAVRTGISSEHVARVRRSEGKTHARGAVKGLKIGTIIGGGFAAYFALVITERTGTDARSAYDGPRTGEGSAYDGPETVAGLATLMVASGAFYGVIIGAIVGAEKWTTVYTTPQRVSLVPAPGTAPGIGIRVGF